MLTGNKQICIYGEESVYGTAVSPNSHFGIVLGGSLDEDNELNYIYPPGVNVPSKIDYMTSGYNGRITSTFNPIVFINWAMMLKSYTIDAGVAVSGVGGILPRRFIGAMCNSCTIDMAEEQFIHANYEFIAQRCINGAIPTMLAPLPLYINTHIEMTVNGVPVGDFNRCSINISNGLEGVYTTDRNKPDMRSFSKLKAKNRKANVTISRNGYSYNPMRGTQPESYIEINIGILDVCSNLRTLIKLIDCKQRKVSEQLQPVKPIDFVLEYECRDIISMTM